MKLSQLLSCTPFLLPPTRHHAQTPLAAHLRQVGAQAMPTSPSRPAVEPAPNRMSSLVRCTPQEQADLIKLEHAQAKATKWVLQCRRTDRENLLQNQLTSFVHQFIDERMPAVLQSKGNGKTYRETILAAANKMTPTNPRDPAAPYIAPQGGPGLLACKLLNCYQQELLDVSNKNPPLQAASKRAIHALTTALAQEQGVITPDELQSSLERAHQAYLDKLATPTLAQPRRVRHSLGRVDSVRLARGR